MSKSDTSKLILTIEDSPTDQTFIKKTLENNGYAVCVADTGEAGLNFIKSKKIDLVILDEMLPDMRGTEICKILRDDPATRDLPVIFLTVVNEPESVFEHFDLDVISHLVKPISGKTLIDQVEAILR